METREKDETSWERSWDESRKRGKIVGGLIVVAIGVTLLLRQMGVEFPEWLFTWEMILIVVGCYIGIKHRFRHPGWIIMIMIGGIFLVNDVFPEITVGPMIWPLMIILFGIFIILKPRRKCYPGHQHRWKRRWESNWKENQEGELSYAENNTAEDRIETVAVFGGVKKNIISKNFKGGEVTCVFGGAEINLMQADITGKAVLEMTCVFGGTKLIVPSHWEIQNHELVAVLGGIEDKRHVRSEAATDSTKVLLLKGTCFLGGIEIDSY